ncbi:MAG: hypothetical protein IK076_00155, partial [Bacteroidales bacterium]|nr:hypothetical protein [Bacteroidales bacterium]
LLIDNCEIRASRIVSLRDDYGSSWDGDIIVRNTTFKPQNPNRSSISLVSGYNDGTHDFGYDCCLPGRIEMENVTIDDSSFTNEDYTGPNIFGAFGRDVTKPGLLPFKAEGKVILKNVTVASGKPVGVSLNEKMFTGYEIVRE